jgi:hypothetical protein
MVRQTVGRRKRTALAGNVVRVFEMGASGLLTAATVR